MNIDVKTLAPLCENRWHGILTRLGVPGSYLTGKHGPCLFCGGEDRWRWTNSNGNGSYFCNQCSSGTGFSLAMKFLNIDFPTALKRVAGIVGECQTQQPTPAPDTKKMLEELWESSTTLTGADPASLYLRSRGLTFKTQGLRYCPSCYESSTKTKMPAMVARVSPSSGPGGTLHRTYLTIDGKKAAIPSPKKLMPGKGGAVGCSVRLFPRNSKLFPENNHGILGVAEGIENGISAAMLYNLPCWAVTGCACLESFVPPTWAREIVIFGDNDANFVGQISAYKLASRLYADSMIVSVEFPETAGKDFNDVLREKYDLPNL